MIQILLKIGIIIMALIFCGIAFSIFYRMLKNALSGAEESLKNREKKQKKENAASFSKAKRNLSKNGIMYRFGNYNMTPTQYDTIRFFAGAVIVVIMLLLDLGFISIIGLPIGFIGFDIVLKKMNAADNESMSIDIYNTYANLKIQLSSGVYLGDCLEYTYKIVQNKRYKEALSEFILNFSDKTVTSIEAVEIFRNRFNSKEIDKLCSMMVMFVQYGISENYIQDIMTEIQSILSADSLRKEHGIEQKTGFITFGFFALVIALVIVAMAQMFSGISLF